MVEVCYYFLNVASQYGILPYNRSGMIISSQGGLQGCIRLVKAHLADAAWRAGDQHATEQRPHDGEAQLQTAPSFPIARRCHAPVSAAVFVETAARTKPGG